jgi:putative membrane protein
MRAAVVVAFLATHDILAKYVYVHPPTAVPAEQAEAGGQLMYYGGDLLDLILITVFCRQWYTATAPAPRRFSAGRHPQPRRHDPGVVGERRPVTSIE